MGEVDIDQTAFSAGDVDTLMMDCYLPEGAGTTFTLNNEGMLDIKVGGLIWRDGSTDGIGEIKISGWNDNPLATISYYNSSGFGSLKAVDMSGIKEVGMYEISVGVMTKIG